VRSGATVPRLAARPAAAVQQFVASDAVPSPGAVAAEPDATPGRRAAPLPEAVRGGSWRAAAQDEPWDEPWQEVA